MYILDWIIYNSLHEHMQDQRKKKRKVCINGVECVSSVHSITFTDQNKLSYFILHPISQTLVITVLYWENVYLFIFHLVLFLNSTYVREHFLSFCVWPI